MRFHCAAAQEGLVDLVAEERAPRWALRPAVHPADAFSAHHKEVSWSDDSQVGILRDLVRLPTRPLGEISFGQGLQTPGDPPEQDLSVLFRERMRQRFRETMNLLPSNSKRT